MKKEIEKLIKAIGDDYERWTLASHRANNWSHPAEPGIEKFRDAIEVKEGSKYIKILTEKSIWGFVNKGNKDFEVGDILKSNGRAPALNRPRGNIFSRILNQFFMIFNNLGADGGLFVVIGKKNSEN